MKGLLRLRRAFKALSEKHGGAHGRESGDHAGLEAPKKASHSNGGNNGQHVQHKHDGVGFAHALVLALALAGCKTTHSLDAASHTDAATAAQIETHETKSEGPEHIVMTVEEFSQLCDPKETHGPVSGGSIGPVPNARVEPVDEASRLAPVQTLIRRTVTVTDRGPSLDDLRTISSLQSKLNSATTVNTKDESKPGGIFSLWFLVGLLPLVAGVLIWKLKPAWLGIAWGLVKSLFGRKA